MSTPLSPEDHLRYTEIVDGILATADLNTISRGKIRKGLELALGGKDLSAHKSAIKAIIENRFDAISADSPGDVTPSSQPTAAAAPTTTATPSKRQANGHPEEHVVAAKKKQRCDSSTAEDADAKLAAQLQAQENNMARGRTTRGSGTGSGRSTAKTTKKKATARKKSAARVKADDDSDVDGSDANEPPKRKAGGGFQKPFNLSAALADVCGASQLPRPQVVKKLWEYIKANELQDPKDRRQIVCDEKLQAVFKNPKTDMFLMNRAIGNHLYPVEEE